MRVRSCLGSGRFSFLNGVKPELACLEEAGLVEPYARPASIAASQWSRVLLGRPRPVSRYHDFNVCG